MQTHEDQVYKLPSEIVWKVRRLIVRAMLYRGRRKGEKMSNRGTGTKFETALCEMLADTGFWAHNLAQNKHGQPADIIAVKNGKAYLIDCKVCSTDKGFPFSRVEENQRCAMELWEECGNGSGWFAVSLPNGEVYMCPYPRLVQFYETCKKVSVPLGVIRTTWIPFDEWVESCS